MKVVCLVSGGIDSPVAAAMLARKYDIIPVHFAHYPFYCRGSFDLALKILARLQKKTGFKHAYIVPWAPILSAALKSPHKKYMCMVCRKGMFLAAEKIAKREKAVAIATGEALAQKASQTLANLNATDVGFDVYRPLIGLDKTEIEALSKRLGIWGEEHVGCCTATPEYPATRADPKVVDAIMAELGTKKLVDAAVAKAIKVSSFEKGEEYFKKIIES